MFWTLLFNYQTLDVPGLSNPESAVKYKHMPFLYCNIYVEQETTLGTLKFQTILPEVIDSKCQQQKK